MLITNQINFFFYNIESLFFLIVVCLLLFLLCKKIQVKLNSKLLKNKLNNTNSFIHYIIYCFLNFFCILISLYDKKFYFFNMCLVSTNFIIFTKIIILISSLFILLVNFNYGEYEENFNNLEFYFLYFVSILSFFILISSNDFLTLYLTIELQTLIFYILTGFKQSSIWSIEAALKYFILGTFSSSILLYGISMIYGYTGSLNFIEINSVFQMNNVFNQNKFIIIGILLFLFSLMFKITAAPFHMWGPDVYQGAPTLITFFFSLTPKIVFLFLLIRLSLVLNSFLQPWSSYIFVSCGIFSMILGSLSVILQAKLKRMLAYSSISNIGYFLIALSTNHLEGFISGIFFIIIYLFVLISFFTALITSRYFTNYIKIKNIAELLSVTNSNLPINLCILVNLFSLVGLPPFAGFFSKLYLFVVTISSELYVVLFFAILSSIISAIIYLRVIRLSFFNKSNSIFLFTPVTTYNSFILMFCLMFNFLILFDSTLIMIFIVDALFSEF